MAERRFERLRELYEGNSAGAHRFRYWLLVFDLVTITFVIATSFSSHGKWIEAVDALFGVVIFADFAARLLLANRRLRFLILPATLADIVAIVSFLAPLAGEGLGFLRVVRTLRLLHTYQLLHRLRMDFPFFRKNEDVIIAAINLIVFLFVMTGLVYATQYQSNPQIANYADALYFTVTALTTTGFGDITLAGTSGRMISVLVMIFGVTLFLRLAQVMFRPLKVRQVCQTCGLSLHDQDAIHCKHCGAPIRIETEGLS
ncbi:potassium channel family protein [Defluviimonas sp. WL0002]|uniref:Potassium channel family protein n=1 Tax=Albidovulum marisflavi TaxID=2984159 RepID=A0ABT2Z7P5_9RHOB|nr:potassium channel family protein [Defluviimonas sp. WL0002]MCV2867116.1 potassium channel family protein [Defluviimonas sp. WL0002]